MPSYDIEDLPASGASCVIHHPGYTEFFRNNQVKIEVLFGKKGKQLHIYVNIYIYICTKYDPISLSFIIISSKCIRNKSTPNPPPELKKRHTSYITSTQKITTLFSCRKKHEKTKTASLGMIPDCNALQSHSCKTTRIPEAGQPSHR